MKTFDGIIDRLDVRPTGSGSLSGLTFAVKDMFDLQGRTAGFGNPDWKRSHAPAKENAPVVDQLLSAGAHLIFNACADEMACSLDGINEHYGVPINPQDVDRIPGGSSSGSASLVAREEVDFALGTDTAGSIRVPASYCGIFGYRPTLNAIDSRGVIPLGPSFDTVGVLTRSAQLLERVADVLLPPDIFEADSPKNSSQNDAVQTTTLRTNARQPDGHVATTLILPKNLESVLDPLVAPYVVSYVDSLKPRFTNVRYIDLYNLGREVYEVFSIIRGREAWLCHGNWLESTKPHLSKTIRHRMNSFREISDDAFNRASIKQVELLAKSDEIVNRESVICLPTTWNIPPLKSASQGELEDNRSRNICITTVASFYGFPQISIPIPAGRMKIGVSLMGARDTDRALLRLANELTA